jgi:hypothetical protein
MCNSNRQKMIRNDTKKKDFIGTLGKLGDIEALNDLGSLGTDVGRGLRTLAHVSNSIRTGEGNVSSAAKNADAPYVLNATGIGGGEATQAASFNPGVVNRAYQQAQNISDRVRHGKYTLEDIPNTFQDIQNLSQLIKGIFTPSKSDQPKATSMCGASPYATDLISFAPKFKFLFVVQFEFTAPYVESDKLQASFVIKTSTRPNINFEYDEVNMYNFWTKIPKRTVYEPMSMTFYDDNKNQVMQLYDRYLKAMSPIANMPFEQKMEDVRGGYDNIGMSFDADTYSASYGPTADPDTMNIFKRITLFHVYDWGKLMNVYKFFNPKILQMELDELTMVDNGDGNEMTFQFAYDGMHIETGYDITDTAKYDIETLSNAQGAAKYPLHYIDGGSGGASGGQGAKDPNKEAGGLGAKISNIGSTITDAASGAIDAGTGLVSNAMSGINKFGGSIFN